MFDAAITIKLCWTLAPLPSPPPLKSFEAAAARHGGITGLSLAPGAGVAHRQAASAAEGGACA
jgi:hypothetical protein